LAKTNYNQVRRQKEIARKARQQEKLARKQARVATDADATAGTAAAEVPAVPAIKEMP
jgi:hypothetical protein